MNIKPQRLSGEQLRLLNDIRDGLAFTVQRKLDARRMNLNFKNMQGDTPLHLADQPKTMKVLLEGRANPFVKNADGEFPIETSIRRGNYHCAEALIIGMNRKSPSRLRALRHRILVCAEEAFNRGNQRTLDVVQNELGIAGLSTEPLRSYSEARVTPKAKRYG